MVEKKEFLIFTISRLRKNTFRMIYNELNSFRFSHKKEFFGIHLPQRKYCWSVKLDSVFVQSRAPPCNMLEKFWSHFRPKVNKRDIEMGLCTKCVKEFRKLLISSTRSVVSTLILWNRIVWSYQTELLKTWHSVQNTPKISLDSITTTSSKLLVVMKSSVV